MVLGWEREQAQAAADFVKMVKRARGRDRGRGRLGNLTSGLRNAVWKEHTSYELQGERLYEVHDV